MLGNQGKIGFLIALTVSLLALHFCSQRNINLLNSPGSITTNSDYGGGNSKAIALPFQEGVGFLCQIADQSPRSFCEYTFQLGKDATHGLNFSQFGSLDLNISMTRDGWPLQDYPVRVYLHQYDPNLPKNWHHKIHQINFDTYEHTNGLSLPTEYIQVADWWREASQADMLRSMVDLTNIVSLSILTPEGTPQGLYQIKINQLSTQGKLIPDFTLYGLLSFIWLWFLLHQLIRYLKRIHRQQKRLKRRVIQLSERSHSLQKQATVDPLTKVLNRGGGLELVHRLKVLHTPFCLLYIDLDHFKHLNDRYGHQVGDDVLTQFADIAQSIVHSQGTLIRWGGEEFLGLIRCDDIESAYFTARQIHKQMAAHPWPHQQQVTCSIGIALCSLETPFQQATEKADSALYKAKHNGRNRIEVSASDKKQCVEPVTRQAI